MRAARASAPCSAPPKRCAPGSRATRPAFTRRWRNSGGYQEWAILLSEEAAAHTEWLARTDQALIGLAGAIAAASPGTAFLMARRMDKAVLAARTTHAGTAAAHIAAALQAGGWRLRAEPARAGHVAGRVAGWSLLGPIRVAAGTGPSPAWRGSCLAPAWRCGRRAPFHPMHSPARRGPEEQNVA